MIKKAAVTLCAIVALAMPSSSESITLWPGGGRLITQEEIPRHKTIQVKKGESLWKISKREYGTGNKYPMIAEANKIKSPYRIYPYQELKIPQI